MYKDYIMTDDCTNSARTRKTYYYPGLLLVCLNSLFTGGMHASSLGYLVFHTGIFLHELVLRGEKFL